MSKSKFKDWLVKRMQEDVTPQPQTPTQQQPQQTAQPQVNWANYAAKTQDPTWQSLYQQYAAAAQKNPQDKNNMALGQALQQAAQTRNMALLAPYQKQPMNFQAKSDIGKRMSPHYGQGNQKAFQQQPNP